jgi:hypothetical protein
MNHDDDDDAWAVFWCSILGPILLEDIPAGERRRYLKALSQKEHLLPSGVRKRISLSTLRRPFSNEASPSSRTCRSGSIATAGTSLRRATTIARTSTSCSIRCSALGARRARAASCTSTTPKSPKLTAPENRAYVCSGDGITMPADALLKLVNWVELRRPGQGVDRCHQRNEQCPPAPAEPSEDSPTEGNLESTAGGEPPTGVVETGPDCCPEPARDQRDAGGQP